MCLGEGVAAGYGITLLPEMCLNVEIRGRDIGVTRFVEVGPGAVLCGLIKRIAPQAKTLSLAEPTNLDALRDLMTDTTGEG